MAKKSVIARGKKREAMVAKYAARRAELKAIVNDRNADYDARQAAQEALQKLPRDASPVRLRRRCALSGRPRGVYRKFGLGRNMLRIAAMEGHIPGLRKASW